MNRETIRTDVCIIGAGVSGALVAAELAAAGKKVTVVAKNLGASFLSSGAIDAGTPPDASSTYATYRSRPESERLFASLLVDGRTVADEASVRAGLQSLATLLGEAVPFETALDRPLRVPTVEGTFRRMFAAQTPFAVASHACEGDEPVLVMGSRQLRRSPLANTRTQLVSLDLRGCDWPTESIAARFEADDAFRTAFGDKLASALPSGKAPLLLPPLATRLGATSPWASLSARLGRPVGELLDPSSPIPGMRFGKALRAGLARVGVTVWEDGDLRVTRHKNSVSALQSAEREYLADHYVLATGKFLGGGLRVGFQRVRETVLDLPLFFRRGEQPARFRRLLPREAGSLEGLECLGLWLDEKFRPRDELGAPCFDNVHATGGLVGGADLPRHRLGTGYLAAFAVAVAEVLGGKRL